MHVDSHLVSGKHASLHTLVSNHEEEHSPSQHQGEDEGHTEPCCMEAVVRQNLWGWERETDLLVVTLHIFQGKLQLS